MSKKSYYLDGSDDVSIESLQDKLKKEEEKFHKLKKKKNKKGLSKKKAKKLKKKLKASKKKIEELERLLAERANRFRWDEVLAKTLPQTLIFADNCLERHFQKSRGSSRKTE